MCSGSGDPSGDSDRPSLPGTNDLTFQSNGRCTLTVRFDEAAAAIHRKSNMTAFALPVWTHLRDDFDLARWDEFIANRPESADQICAAGCPRNAAPQSGVTNEEVADA